MSHRDTILTEITQYATLLDESGDTRWAGLNLAVMILSRDLSETASHTDLHTALVNIDNAIGMNTDNAAIRGGLLLAHQRVLVHAIDFADDVLAHT